MSLHTQVKITNLELQLQERMDKLLTAIRGSEPMSFKNDDEDFKTIQKRYVDPSRVRVAVDDFQTILKEIKRELK